MISEARSEETNQLHLSYDVDSKRTQRTNTMSAILLAIAKSAGMMLPIIILVIIASIVSVRRGEALAHHDGEEASDSAVDGDAAVASEGLKLPFMPDRDPTVLEILIIGTVLFGITMGLFLGYSVVGQM
jgi:hypothetical protein